MKAIIVRFQYEVLCLLKLKFGLGFFKKTFLFETFPLKALNTQKIKATREEEGKGACL
jgi:hypothetical protein